jgi:5,10-methylenetetrahydrofolate reductase
MEVKSKLREALEEGEFAITAEICPPRGTDVERFLEKARLLKGKIVAANVTDNQRAVMRLSSLACSVILLKEGIEPVYQITCRDRNRLAIQSDVMGAHALGIRNVLALTGDHVMHGDHRGAKPVFDLDATQLIHTIDKLNHGRNLNDKELRGGTEMYLGAVVAPEADPMEPEWIRFIKKIEMGAKFFQTQAIYDMENYKRFFEKAKKEGVKVLGGILLLKSVNMANFLNKNVPGVNVPSTLIEELESSKDQLQKGIEIASRQLRELRAYADGAHIMAIGQEESVPEIIEGAC